MWIRFPASPTSRSALEPGDLTSDLNSLSLAFAAWATWRGKLRPAKFWLRVFGRGLLTTLRSGLILDPFQPGSTVDVWLESLPAGPALLCPPPAGASGRSIPDGSGPRWPASLSRLARRLVSGRECPWAALHPVRASLWTGSAGPGRKRVRCGMAVSGSAGCGSPPPAQPGVHPRLAPPAGPPGRPRVWTASAAGEGRGGANRG
jgi:hypothetical protein